MKLPSTPQDAAHARSYINLVLAKVAEYDKSPSPVLYQWVSKALTSKNASSLDDSEGYVRTDRTLATKLLEATKSGTLMLKFQAMQETARVTGIPPKGRVMLWHIFREFDLHKESNALLSQQFLLDLRVKGNDVNALRMFKAKAELILTQLTEEERPKESTMKNWLFLNLEKHPLMARAIETWNDRPLTSSKRSYKWLWDKMNRAITNKMNDLNTASVKAALAGGTVPGAAGAVKAEKGKKEKKAKKDKKDKKTPSKEVPAAPGVSTPRAKSKYKAKGPPPKKDGARDRSTTPTGKLTATESKNAVHVVCLRHLLSCVLPLQTQQG